MNNGSQSNADVPVLVSIDPMESTEPIFVSFVDCVFENTNVVVSTRANSTKEYFSAIVYVSASVGVSSLAVSFESCSFINNTVDLSPQTTVAAVIYATGDAASTVRRSSVAL